MVFQAPTLEAILASETQYVIKWASNISKIQDAFNTIEADLAQTFEASGMEFAEDWVRRASTSDPAYGLIGAYNFWFEDTGSNVITLKVSPVSGKSEIIVGSLRRSVTSDLAFTLTTLALGDGAHTIFVGLDTAGTSSVTIGVSTAESDIELILYEVEVTVSGGGATYAVDRVKRRDKTMFWDNTVEQKRQDVPFVMTWAWEGLSTGDDWRFTIPVDARLLRMVVWNEADLGSSQINLQDSAGTTTYVQWSENPAADEVSILTPTTWDGVAFAAANEFLVDVALLTGGPARVTVSFEFVPTYNLPTV